MKIQIAPVAPIAYPSGMRGNPVQGLKTLFLIDGMEAITAGGTERQVLQLIRIALKHGLAAQLCILRGTAWLTPELAGCPVRYAHLGSIGSSSGLAELRQLVAWMRAEKFDIVQTYFADANLIGPILSRLSGVPVVIGSRRNLNHHPMSLLWRGVQAVSNQCTDQILANSAAVVERIRKSEWLAAPKLAVLYNGVDLAALRVPAREGRMVRSWLRLPPDGLLVGNISGLRKIKGIGTFVQAAALAHARMPELRFVVVGEGEMRPEVEAQIQRLGLEGIVTLAGAQEDVLPWLAAMDVAVLCSDAEGFSNSLLEYMAAGLPVIATEVGGNREALGESGILVPPGDAQAIADHLCRLAAAELRDRYSYAALQEVKRFDLAVAEKRMGELYATYAGWVARRRPRGVPAQILREKKARRKLRPSTCNNKKVSSSGSHPKR
jgi:L-malate glycosyltransferase